MTKSLVLTIVDSYFLTNEVMNSSGFIFHVTQWRFVFFIFQALGAQLHVNVLDVIKIKLDE